MKSRWLLAFILAGWTAGPCVAASTDTSTLHGKMIMGYQGWFACPNDGSGRGWVHWTNDKGTPYVDLLPDVTQLDPDELCESGWKDSDGRPIQLFSSQNAKTVDRHFRWMQDYGLDGVALQRFASELNTKDERIKNSLDRVLGHVRASAERHGRSWFVMYDLSGRTPEQLDEVVQDWKALVAAGITKDRAYQRHAGKPVLGIWGIGFRGRPLTPTTIERFLADLRAQSAEIGGLTILGGLPTYWREGVGDASPDPAWRAIWPHIDVLSPWTVGRFSDDDGVQTYDRQVLAKDIEEAKRLHVEIMPVVFPGFSWANLMRARGEPAKAKLNQIPRRCGAFYDAQVNGILKVGARMGYTAMFDEVDEGTAVMPVRPVSDTSGFTSGDPSSSCNNPPDHFMRLVHAATQRLRASAATQRALNPAFPAR